MKRSAFVLLVVAAFAFAFGCEKVQLKPGEEISEEVVEEGEKEAAGEEAGEVDIPPPSTPGTVATVTIGDKARFNVEIAETDEERRRGLMGRESLPPNFGMWFVFPQETMDPFWMKDTLVPLDIIYVDRDMKVVHIIQSAVPGSIEMLRSSKPYLYVLEVEAGAVEKYNIKIGDTVVKGVG